MNQTHFYHYFPGLQQSFELLNVNSRSTIEGPVLPPFWRVLAQHCLRYSGNHMQHAHYAQVPQTRYTCCTTLVFPYLCAGTPSTCMSRRMQTKQRSPCENMHVLGATLGPDLSACPSLDLSFSISLAHRKLATQLQYLIS
jgi:hypothetical protein